MSPVWITDDDGAAAVDMVSALGDRGRRERLLDATVRHAVDVVESPEGWVSRVGTAAPSPAPSIGAKQELESDR